MFNPKDIVYSQRNDANTVFVETRFSPTSSNFLIIDIDGKISSITGSFLETGSLYFITSSWAESAAISYITSHSAYAFSASISDNSRTSSFSFLSNTSSYSISSSYSNLSKTSSFSFLSNTSSYSISSSYSNLSKTSSFSFLSNTSSYSISSSYSNLSKTSSFSFLSNTSSFSINSISSSYSENSFYALSASYISQSVEQSESSSYSFTSSYISGSIYFGNVINGYFPQWINNTLSLTSSIYYEKNVGVYIDDGMGYLFGTSSMSVSSSHANNFNKLPHKLITTSYNINLNDYMLYVSASNENIIILLPSPEMVNSQIFKIKKIDNSGFNCILSSSKNIDYNVEFTLTTQGEFITLHSDSEQYWIV
jgi:hypothetical protein